MNNVLSNLIEFSESEEAKRIEGLYEKGLITHEEAESLFLQEYEDSKYYFFIQYKGSNRRWKNSSLPLTKRAAEKRLNELNSEGLLDVNGKKIIYRIIKEHRSGVLLHLKWSFDDFYNYLYESAKDDIESKLAALFDSFENKDLISDFVKYRGDLITSDREAAAFILAIEKKYAA